jgi:O-antigen/teichoic acid export membrane protein
MNDVQRIAKNTGVYGISQIITSSLGFILLIYIARYLGEIGFGKYSFALAFTYFFVVFADIGINQLIIREISRDKELAEVYLTNVFLLKLLLSILAIISIIIIINLMDYPQDTTYVVYLFGIYTILSSFILSFMSMFQAFEKLEYTAIVTLIREVILVSLVVFVLSSGYGLIEVGYIYIFTGVVGLVLSFLIVLMKIAKPKRVIDLALWRKLIIGGTPFALNALFAVFFFRTDTVMLSVLKGDAAVGIYNAAYNPLLALGGIISGMLVAAIYPVMSRYYISSRDALEPTTILASRYMALIGFPIAIGCFLLADRVIDLFYAGQFSASIITFQILALFIPIRLVSSITGTLLTSINRQGLRTISIGLSALFNIFLNALMIPCLSYIGAGIATVLSEILLYFILIHYISRYYKKFVLYKHYTKPMIASIFMGFFIFYFKNTNLFLLILSAAMVYFLILFLLRAFTAEDKNIFNQIVRRR